MHYLPREFFRVLSKLLRVSSLKIRLLPVSNLCENFKLRYLRAQEELEGILPDLDTLAEVHVSDFFILKNIFRLGEIWDQKLVRSY